MVNGFVGICWGDGIKRLERLSLHPLYHCIVSSTRVCNANHAMQCNDATHRDAIAPSLSTASPCPFRYHLPCSKLNTTCNFLLSNLVGLLQ